VFLFVFRPVGREFVFSFQDVVNGYVADIHHAGNLGIGATPVVFQAENLGNVFLLKLIPAA
jgi:hypothetical protein